MSFADPVKPQWPTTESMGPLMGTNKAARDVKLLLTIILSYSFCALLKTQHCCLPPCGWFCPLLASQSPPPSRLPPINFIRDIAGVVKPSQKPAVLANSYKTLAIKLLYSTYAVNLMYVATL